MKIRILSDEAIGATVGGRIKKLRLQANLSQEEVVKASGISRQTLINLESHGKGTLATLIAVLRALDCLDRLSSLVEEVRSSPIKALAMGGKVRIRASGTRAAALSTAQSPASKRKPGVEW